MADNTITDNFDEEMTYFCYLRDMIVHGCIVEEIDLGVDVDRDVELAELNRQFVDTKYCWPEDGAAFLLANWGPQRRYYGD